MRVFNLLFPLYFLIGSLFAQGQSVVYPVGEVDVPPHFSYDVSTCHDVVAQCASQALFIYLDRNMNYPSLAYQDKLEGKATVEVVVEATGALTEIQLLENPGKGTGEEALRLIRSMNNPATR